MVRKILRCRTAIVLEWCLVSGPCSGPVSIRETKHGFSAFILHGVMMQLSVKGKQIDVGDSLRQHVEANLKDIVGKFFSSPLDAHVTFSREAHLFRADIGVHAGRGITLQSDASASDPYAAFDAAAAKIAKRLRRHKTRLRDHHKYDQDPRESVMAQAFVLHGTDDDSLDVEVDTETEREGGDHPVIVAEMTTPIELLTVSEAVMRLDLGNMPALMFRNGAHGQLNMIYRRPDGHIGWIDPAQNIAINQKTTKQAPAAKAKAKKAS